MRVDRVVQGLAPLLLGSVLICGWPAACRAEEAKPAGTMCPICHRATAQDTEYAEKAGRTLARGATNVCFGWTEVIRQPGLEARHHGNVFSGIGRGVGEAVRRTVGGIGEVLTFWTPKINRRYLSFSADCPICAGKRTKP